MTFNEVISICELGYERDTFAPGVSAGLGVGACCAVLCGVVWMSGRPSMKLLRSANLVTRGTPLRLGLVWGWVGGSCCVVLLAVPQCPGGVLR
jgi:hypothetical protein